MKMQGKHIIEVESLRVRYDGRWVLRDLDLQMAPGEKVTMTGPSGSGKSTVLRCLLGLVVPEGGSVRVLGQPVNGRHVWQVRRGVSYVPQEPQIASGTVREVLELPFSYRANAALRENLKRLGELMERFYMPRELLDKETSSLSGGEKQRVALISAIMLDRPILLLDEASSALDAKSKQAVAEFLRPADELTVLSVSHDKEWLDFSNRSVDLAEGVLSRGGRS